MPDAPVPWFQLRTSSAFAFLPGVVSPVELSPDFDRIVELARDAAARPHERAAADLVEVEARAVAELLVQVAHEDGHAIMLAGALHALVRRIASNASPDRIEVLS